MSNMRNIQPLDVLIGKSISRLREQRNYSVTYLAIIAGLSVETLREVEEGELRATSSDIVALSNALRCPLEAIFPEKRSARSDEATKLSELRYDVFQLLFRKAVEDNP